MVRYVYSGNTSTHQAARGVCVYGSQPIHVKAITLFHSEVISKLLKRNWMSWVTARRRIIADRGQTDVLRWWLVGLSCRLTLLFTDKKHIPFYFVLLPTWKHYYSQSVAWTPCLQNGIKQGYKVPVRGWQRRGEQKTSLQRLRGLDAGLEWTLPSTRGPRSFTLRDPTATCRSNDDGTSKHEADT